MRHTVSVQKPVALLALIGTEYAATDPGTASTMAPIDTERPIEPVRAILNSCWRSWHHRNPCGPPAVDRPAQAC